MVLKIKVFFVNLSDKDRVLFWKFVRVLKKGSLKKTKNLLE
jgi:hypothetical protein